MNKKKLLALICLIAAGVIGFIVIYRYFDSVPVTFTTTNLQKITIKNSIGSVLHQSSNPTTLSLRIPKQTSIQIEFVGKDGYEANKKSERIGNKPETVSIKPYYSKVKLAGLAANEQMTLTTVLERRYNPVIGRYSLSDFQLYHFGEWVSVVLRQKGVSVGQTDTLKVILKKTDNTWSIVATPTLLFYENNHKDVPVDILRQINYS